jgi:hypothetical protein
LQTNGTTESVTVAPFLVRPVVLPLDKAARQSVEQAEKMPAAGGVTRVVRDRVLPLPAGIANELAPMPTRTQYVCQKRSAASLQSLCAEGWLSG